MKRNLGTQKKLRLIIQLVFLLFSAAWLIALIFGIKASLHSLCMYAGVCFGLGQQGSWVSAGGVFTLTVIFSLAVFIFTIFRGREFCGYICALGTIQEALFAVRKRSYRIKHRIPFFYDRKLAWLKYLILGISSVMAITGTAYIYIRFCPIYTLSLIPRILAPGIAVLILCVIIPGIFIERFWCRFLCPYAALLNIAQALGNLFRIRRKKIKRNLERCIDCGLCSLHCPMNINITDNETVESIQCIHCRECVCNCPKPGTISNCWE